MRTVIYVEDGAIQLVITPETDFEENAVKSLGNNTLITKIFRGSFYQCNGGWVRYDQDTTDNSLIIRAEEEVKKNEPM